MLTIGSSGAIVKKIQEALNKKTIMIPGVKTLVADGQFGKLTSDMVKLYQAQNNLKISGIVDNATAIKLGFFPSDIQQIKPTVPVNTTPIQSPASFFPQPSFFERNKRNIMLVGGGLALVLAVSLFLKKDKSVTVKSNPQKKNKITRRQKKSLKKLWEEWMNNEEEHIPPVPKQKG